VGLFPDDPSLAAVQAPGKRARGARRGRVTSAIGQDLPISRTFRRAVIAFPYRSWLAGASIAARAADIGITLKPRRECSRIRHVGVHAGDSGLVGARPFRPAMARSKRTVCVRGSTPPDGQIIHGAGGGRRGMRSGIGVGEPRAQGHRRCAAKFPDVATGHCRRWAGITIVPFRER